MDNEKENKVNLDERTSTEVKENKYILSDRALIVILKLGVLALIIIIVAIMIIIRTADTLV